MAQNNQQGQEQEESGGISIVRMIFYAAVIYCVLTFAGKCTRSSQKSSSTNKTEMVHKGLYDEGFEMGYSSSHGMPMSVEQAWEIRTEKVVGAPDNPTPEFVQGFYDGQDKK